MSIEFIEKINRWGDQGLPFLFVIDFEQEKPFACLLEEAIRQGILFDVLGYTNAPQEPVKGPLR